MKLKTTIAALAGLLLAVSSYGQGTVTFNNTPTTAVTDFDTGTKVALGVAIAGLYFSSNLSEVPDRDGPTDGYTLVSTANIGNPASPLFDGVYSGGTVTVDGAVEGQDVVFQIRAWSVGYASYAEAWAAGASVGQSNTGVLTLGGTGIPASPTSSFVETFEIAPVPEPTTVVLGLVGGVCAMVLLRRRK